MPALDPLPGRNTTAYRLLELIAVCGELPVSQLTRLPGGESYKKNVVQSLKQQKLLHTFYRDKLRGYRLNARAKPFLISANPDRFLSVLSRENSHVKSESSRRLRLHRIAEAIITMSNAGVHFFNDDKPEIFSPDAHPSGLWINSPSFYISREIKALGKVFTKIYGARSVGLLLTAREIYIVYNLGDSLIKWSYQSELRTKAVMKSVLCRELLPHQYPPNAIHALVLGNRMELASQILSEDAGRQYYILDGNYEHLYFFTNDRKGEHLVRLLCAPHLQEKLDQILLADLYEGEPGINIENDAVDADGNPVLLGYLCDLSRIRRFSKALRLLDRKGTLICFDFQGEALRAALNNHVHIQTIDYEQWERSFFEPP